MTAISKSVSISTIFVQYKSWIYLFLNIIALVTGIALTQSDYMTHRTYRVVVDGKAMVPGTRKSHGYPVISYWSAENKVIFDQRVSVGTYTHANVGDIHEISITPFQMKQTGRQNVLYFFLPVFLISCGGVFSVAMLIEIGGSYLKRKKVR